MEFFAFDLDPDVSRGITRRILVLPQMGDDVAGDSNVGVETCVSRLFNGARLARQPRASELRSRIGGEH